MDGDATICAPATPRGMGALAILRLSGPAAHAALAALAGGPVAADRRLRLRVLRDPDGGGVLDEALVVAFADGASPTGEAAAELHLHGGPAVVAAVMAALTRRPGVRLAAPGEFSRRAFAAGRMDLTRLEGVADLIAAETEDQRRQAARLMQGALSDRAAAWTATLTGARALLEAALDFAEEDGIGEDAVAEARRLAAALLAELDAALAGARGAALTREGAEVVLVGPPNAGKSSLLNALAGREVALTSPLPGTTRDALEVRCDLGGMLATLVDTAGQRESDDPLERAGVDWARRRAASADLRVVVEAPDARGGVAVGPGDLLVWNKADLGPGPGMQVSARTGEGLAALLAEIGARLGAVAGEGGLVARARHRTQLAAARDHVAAALAAEVEVAAEELRLAARALDGLVGRVDAEGVLDEIFSRFCLGK